MFLLKRIVTIISCILGGSVGIIILGTFNWIFQMDMSFESVFLFGLIGGAIAGVSVIYLVTLYLMRKARRFVQQKMGEQPTARLVRI